MGFWDGVKETGGDLGEAIRKMFPWGWSEKEIEDVRKDVKEAEEEFGDLPWYEVPVKSMTGMEISTIQSMVSWVIVGLLIFLVIRD